MIGIVVGLEAEARLARRWNLPVAIGNGTADGAARAADALAPTVQALLSFGLAGGLDPTLPAGAILVPHTILDGAQSWATDPALNAALGGPTPHALIGAGTILVTPAEKHHAHITTDAHAIDLESAAVARAAARHGLPFAALRAVCDPAGRTLPRAALLALDAAGRILPLSIAASLLAHPGQLPALIALARDAARARRALLARIRATAPLHLPP